MRKLVRSAGLITLVVMLLLVTAVPVLAAAYYAVFVVAETGGVPHEKLPVIIYIDNDWMVDQGFMGSTGMGTKVQLGGSYLPHMVADNKTLMVLDLPANSNKGLVYYMGTDNLAASLPVIPGYDGYVTVADNSTLELGDNFTVTVDGWWNTDNGTEKNAVIKDGAFKLAVDAVTNKKIIGAIFTADSSPASGNLSQNGLGGWSAGNLVDGNIASPGFDTDASANNSYMRIDYGAGNEKGLTGWQYYVDGAVVAIWNIQYSDDAATWTTAYTGLNCAGGAGWKSCSWEYTGEHRYWQSLKTNAAAGGNFHMELEVGGWFPSVTAPNIDNGDYPVRVDLLHNMLTNGDFESGDPPDDWTLVGAGGVVNQDGVTKKLGSYSANLTRNGTDTSIYQQPSNWEDYKSKTVTMGTWVYATTANNVRLWLRDGIGGTIVYHSGSSLWEWLTATLTVDSAATLLQPRCQVITANVTGYFDGAVLVHGSTVGTGGNFIISVDGVEKDATFCDNTTPVPNNTENWTFMQNNVLPYADNITISVNGTQQLYFAPSAIIVGTTLPDRATATNNDGIFTWGSNTANVSANMTSFLPVSEAKAPAFALGESPLFITATPNITSSFTVVPPGGTFPLAPVIAAIASATDTPEQLPLLIIAAFVILAASLSVSAIIRQHGSGSILVKIATITVFMGVFIALGNFGIDFWMLVVFLIIGVALGFASKQLGWS